MNPTSNSRHRQDESCSQSQSVRGETTETAIAGIGERLANALEGIFSELKRIADHFDPPPPDKVGTPYVAEKLGCTTVWITEMIRTGEIPASCVVLGTGNGKPWKLHRVRIDEWLRRR